MVNLFLILRSLSVAFRRGWLIFIENPIATSAAVAAISLGCGVGFAAFTLVDAILYRPMPVADVERLFKLSLADKRPGSIALTGISFLDYQDLLQQVAPVLDLACYLDHAASLRLPGGDTAEHISAAFASRNYFAIVGIAPAIGRFFDSRLTLPRGADEAVLSYSAWKSRFAGDVEVVGRTIFVNGVSTTIVGVTPQSFHGLELQYEPAVWLPLDAESVSMHTAVRGNLWTKRQIRWFGACARLKAGVSAAEVSLTLKQVSDQLAVAYPDTNAHRGFVIAPIMEAQVSPLQRASLKKTAGILWAMSGCIVLITLANLSLLLVGRSIDRTRTTAIRLALGARWYDVMFTIWTEALLLTLAGVIMAVPIGYFLAQALTIALGLPDASRGITWWGWGPAAFVFGICGTTALAASVAPALHLWRRDVLTALRSSSSQWVGASRWMSMRTLLVLGQVALTVPLSFWALRMSISMHQIDAVARRGFEGTVWLSDIDPTSEGYNPEQRQELYRRLLEDIQRVPGVQQAAIATIRPLSRSHNAVRANVDGRSVTSLEDEWLLCNAVSDGYFATMGLPIRAGRSFSDSDDRPERAVVVVNETFAKLFLRKQPVGAHLNLPDEPHRVYEVIGVVADSKYSDLSETPIPYIYLPLRQWNAPVATLHLRTTQPASIVGTIPRLLAKLDPNLFLYNVSTVKDQLSQSVAQPQAITRLSRILASAALILSLLCVYTMINYLVHKDSVAIAIRLALGADQLRVQIIYVQRAMAVAGLGVAVGVFASMASSPFVSNVSGVNDTPARIALPAVASLVWLSVGLASALAARSAGGKNPVELLRG